MMTGANKNWRRLAIALVLVMFGGGAVVGSSRLFVRNAKSSETSGKS